MEVKELVTYLLTPAAQVALIIALAELVKQTGFPTRFIPVVDLVLGLVSGFAVYHNGLNIVQCAVLGIAIGLSACGLFSGIKNVFEREKDDAEGRE